MSRAKLEILDSTLRDGAQGEGVSFSLENKLRLTRILDRLGIHWIEGGWIGVNPKDDEYFAAMETVPLRRSRLVAFGLTCRAGARPEADARLKALADTWVATVALVGKASAFQVECALRTTKAENLRLVRGSVSFLKRRGKETIFDAEHFFDGFAADPDYSLDVLAAALKGGADRLVLCDTNGGCLPDRIAAGVAAARNRFPDALLGIHVHDDAGLAVANTLTAIEAGVVHAQGTLNGFGERCGMTDLCILLPDLELKLGRRVIGREALASLTHASRMAYELANHPPRPTQPYVGRAAFAHKGGLHVSGVARDASTYEHVSPMAVGNDRRVLASELAGRANIAALSPECAADPERLQAALKRLQRLEAKGYSFEDADGSFDLMLRRLAPGYAKPFTLHSFRAITDRAMDDARLDNPRVDASAATPVRALSEASVRVDIGAAELHTVAEGRHGPVSALDAALRKALVHVYPFVEQLRLVDYRVHIVNAEAGVAARVRVVMSCRMGRRAFGTVGVSEDVVAASCRALCDAYEWMIVHRGVKAERRRKRLHKI